MENNTQFIDHFSGAKSVLAIALLSLAQKIVRDIHMENISMADIGALTGTLQKLVSCYAELQLLPEIHIPDSHKLVSPEVIDSIQTQLNLL
ncbi:MAG: hypothetical protein LBI77_03430 [Puniceicoccales bacterium]|jgi:hypothetical protein|nr:hypothetical protein [Puniceicoccales bacterium]